MLENKDAWFVHIFECYSIKSIPDYRKMVKFYFSAFCFFRIWFWKGQHDLFHTKIDKFSFDFKESCCLWVFSPRIWNVLWMSFSLKNLLHHLKIWKDDPDITIKLFFWGFLDWKYAKSNIRDCPLNNSLHPLRCSSIPYGSMVSRRFYKGFGSNTVKLFFISKDFLKIFI